jgi:hypothetical protein
MPIDMAERIRLIIDTEEEVRLAIQLAATRAGMSKSEFVNSLLRKALANEIKDARKYVPDKSSEEG